MPLGRINGLGGSPHRTAIAAFVVVLLLAAGFFAHVALSPPKQPIRLAINAWAGYEFAVLARELGYYQQEGVDVRLLELSSLGDVRRAFERGQADGMFGTAIEVVQARRSGRAAVPVLVADFSNGADALVTSGSISSIADLEGKRIGTEAGTLGTYVLMRALDAGGLSIADIEFVHTPHASQRSWMELGLIDGVVTFPPVSTDLLASGSYNNVFSSADIPGEVVDVLAVDANLVESKRDEIEAIRRAYFRAMAFARVNPTLSYRIMGDRLGIPPDEVRRLLEQEIRVVTEDEQREYLVPGGKIDAILERTDAMLEAQHGSGDTSDATVVGVPGEGG